MSPAQPQRHEALNAPSVPEPGYLPIRAYAAVGDCHGAALVSNQGTVDWCALGRFDAPPIFCRLLDARRGGYLATTPVAGYREHREYLRGTNILRTVFETASGRVALLDFMPVGRAPGSRSHDYTRLEAPQVLARRIEVLAGEMEIEIAFRPSVDYAARPAALELVPGRVGLREGASLHSSLRFELQGDVARARTRMVAGQRHDLVVSAAPLAQAPTAPVVDRWLAITQAFWREWIAYCRYEGPYREAVERSALALKLLTYAPTGAIVAAPTTSLPERIGGERNWDYRYCWLRDASFTLYALASLGYSGEARDFVDFLYLVCEKQPSVLQVLYAIDGESQLPEAELDHLEGYSGSRPVRIGNAAHAQHQADVYGEFLDSAQVMKALGGRLPRDFRETLELAVSLVMEHWHEPDQGIWEMRAEPRHHVNGKLMSWVALDRGLALLGERGEWREARDRLQAEIVARGIDPEGGHLVQAYGSRAVDAVLLVAPYTGFPIDHGVFEHTVAQVERELRRGDYVMRYRTEDGIAGDEGAFLICSFWLVDAYLWLGRVREATDLFERLCVLSNDVGLFSEEIAEDGAFLGNFPQAFTHLGLIANAINLQLVAKHGTDALHGGGAERARGAVGATFGIRGLIEAARSSRRVGRILSSRASIMAPGTTGRAP